MVGRILIYGANGYTGELIARFAREQKVDLIVAGRSAVPVRAVAERYGFEHRVFALDAIPEIVAELEGVSVVLHCAGPFSRTAAPMAEACLKSRVHYLDITGEVAVFEQMAARDADARRAGVMLLPGVGFDVVPSDCLAAHLKTRLPDATHLVLGIMGLGGKISRGTATTIVENLPNGSVIRKNGGLTSVPTGSRTRTIDYGGGREKLSMAVAWGDVSTAFHSTGIPNIEVYMPAPRAAIAGAKVMSRLPGVMGSSAVQGFLKRRVDSRPAGPNDQERESGQSLVFGEVKNAQGDVARSWLKTPEGYTLTALTGLAIAQRARDGSARPGFQTPSRVFGPDFVLEFSGVERRDD
jgi:short subunit dehydrogenase-like uncharacterized protein